MPSDFHPLPSTFPSAEALYLLGYLRGQPWDTAVTCHAAWSIMGYAQVQLLNPPHPEAASRMALPHFNLEETLAMIAHPPKLPADATASSFGIDWKSLVLALVEQVIKKLLG